MPSSTENVKLGVCNALFGGRDLGFTKGGVTAEVSTSTYEITVDQLGDTPIGELIIGRMVKATVPMAETALENLLDVLPGSVLISDGVKATGTVTFSVAAPTTNDAVNINGINFVFKASPVTAYEVAPGATFTAAAINFAAAVNDTPCGFTATVAAGVVTITAETRGIWGNVTITKTAGVNIAFSNPTGGVDPTVAKIAVSTGININLSTIGKKLVLRPKGTSGEDDFVILKAASAGALNFSYNTNQERIYNIEFKGYALADGSLLEIGNQKASA